MLWSHTKTEATEALRAGESFVPCPNPMCQSDRPASALYPLWNLIRRGGKVVRVHNGDRLECEECGCSFAVDGRGVYGVRQAAGRQQVNGRVTEPEEEPRPLRPMPKQPPRV